MKQILYTIFFLFLLSPIDIEGQTLKAFIKAADKAYAQEDYYSSMVHLASAMEIEPENIALKFKYAEVCRQFNAYDLARENYRLVVESEDKEKFPLSEFWLAMMVKNLGDYDAASDHFKSFLNKYPGNGIFAKRANMEIEACKWAKNYTPAEDFEIKVDHLNKRVNTPYSEFGAFASGDTLFYSSHRYDWKNDEHTPKRKVSKILYSVRGSKGRPMKRNFNDPEKLTAHQTFSLDRKRIYFTLCNYVGSGKINCSIYYKEKDRRKRWKRTPEKLPATINLAGSTNTHPVIGFDSTAQTEILYFASNRNGGKGKMDIWYTEIDGKKFSNPINIEAINTEQDDQSPFYSNELQTLYFSSNGRKGFGGLDIYSVKKNKEWGKIENLGAPINSSFNDLYYTTNGEANLAYFSSNRPGSFYLDKANKTCCYDIYKMTKSPIEKEEAVPEDSIQAIVVEEPTLDPEPKVPTTLEDFLPLALYFDNDEPDKRTRRTSTKKTYEETYSKYYVQKQDYIINYTEPLDEELSYEAEQELEDFFEDEVRKGYEHLFLFSNILLKRLQGGESVEIFLKGYTSPRAKGDYNLALSKRRISSLRNHFDNYKNGIFRSYLTDGKLIISEKPFGETQASKQVSDNLMDRRNSVYSVGAAVERRVEIVEIKRSGN